MANRVTQAEVEAIFDTALTDLSPFITVANQMVTRYCTGGDMSDAELKEVERWLSAHFASVQDARTASEKAGPVSENYQYKVGLDLDFTKYGQQAMVLDATGGLANWNKDVQNGKADRPATIGWIGYE